MGTLVEEIFSRKTGAQVRAGEIHLVDVDYIMSHDNTTPLAIKAFRDIGKPFADKSKVVLHFDHAYPAPNVLAAQNHRMIADFVAENDLPHLYRQGVCHQVMIEEGFITPGAVVIGADSHSNTYGALGAFGTGLGSTEIGVGWVTGKCWFKDSANNSHRIDGSDAGERFGKRRDALYRRAADNGWGNLPLC